MPAPRLGGGSHACYACCRSGRRYVLAAGLFTLGLLALRPFWHAEAWAAEATPAEALQQRPAPQAPGPHGHAPAAAFARAAGAAADSPAPRQPVPATASATAASTRSTTRLGTTSVKGVASAASTRRAIGPTAAPLGIERDVHVFYYMWYGSKAHDGKWVHWDHEFIPHWDKSVARRFPGGRHDPDNDDIGSTFWPQLGPYSSRDPEVIRTHVRQMREAAIGVVVLSWYPPNLKDQEGQFEHDELLTALLDAAAQQGLEVAIHMEPYVGRTPASVRKDLAGFIARYGGHPALHRRLPAGRHLEALGTGNKEKPLPVVYVYDSYHNAAADWAKVLRPGAKESIRDTDIDAIMLCLWVEKAHESYLAAGGFDGAYTYFAAEGFSYGSSMRNWPAMAAAAKRHGAFLVPSVGPGYNDLKVRPWNTRNVKSREKGKYMSNHFNAAAASLPAFLSITSWNEWHEGSNIEPASAKSAPLQYEDYGPGGPDFYLVRLRELVTSWAATRGLPPPSPLADHPAATEPDAGASAVADDGDGAAPAVSGGGAGAAAGTSGGGAPGAGKGPPDDQGAR